MGTRERKEREKEARRNAILEAAKSVFFEKGFQATTMDQIAEAAELSKGTLYLYFPSKEDLYVSILLEGTEILYDGLIKAVKGRKSWEKKVRNICWAYFTFFRENENYFKIFFLLQHRDMTPNVSDPIFQMCLDKGQECLNVVSQAIQEGIDEGEIPSHNPMEHAVVLWGSLTGIILLHEGNAHKTFLPSSLEHSIRMTIDLMMKGLTKRANQNEAV